MRTIVLVLAMLLFVTFGLSQPNVKHLWTTTGNLSEYLSKYSTKQGLGGTDTLIEIKNRTYAASQIDTTETVPILNFKTIYVDLTTNDSLSMLIRYSPSMDGFTYADQTTLDSLVFVGATGRGFKNVDFTSTLGGFPFVKFIFAVQAWQRGTTTPTYSARITMKKN